MTEHQINNLFETHNMALSAHYGDKLKSMKFSEPELYERDSAVSISKLKQEAFISRHHVAGHHMSKYPTHIVILTGEHIKRL